ncbi:MAG: 16S rRNA (cytidine(1402)-2'-O)-methyltransferase [bacterium]|nr:16S rRNA (cytidine(1402)-2'-O)-methyltransferase [bacterium]
MELEANLYLVATPIGNLEDITFRAINIFKEVDFVIAEDSRRTGLLLHHYGIKKQLIIFHDHNREMRTAQIISEMKLGKKFAMVSDSGTPSISDPGFYLVRAAIEAGFKVSSIPGPSAAISALIISGMPTHNFVFEGFLPNTKLKRQHKLQTLINEQRTIIFFESPHRLLEMLKDCKEIFGERKIAVAHELTKKFESVIRGNASEVIDYYSSKTPKGEFVVVIEGNKQPG